MDEMEIDPSLPSTAVPLKPRDRILQRLSRLGVAEEYLQMSYPGIVDFVKNGNSYRMPELVNSLFPSDEEFAEILKDSKAESKKATNAAVRQHMRESIVFLQWIIFMGDPSAAFKRLANLSSGRGVCGAVWGDNDIAYRCRTCEHDPTCAICVSCFINGDHKDHDYSIIYTGGGCCDCGDVTAWTREGFCSKHKGVEQIVPLPEEFTNSVGPALDALFCFWKDKLVFIESIWKENYRGNGDSNTLKEKATNKLSLVIVEMILDFCKHSESLLSFVSKSVISLDGFLEILVKAECFLSESVVKKLQEMLLKLIGEPTFKYSFANAFLSYYPFVVQQVIREGTDEVMKKYPLLSKFSVQIFTVPTLTPQLVKEMDLLSMLLTCLEKIFVHCAAENGCLSVSKWGNLYQISIRVVDDIRFVLSHDFVPKYVNKERKDVLKAWMNILELLQGMSPLKRQTGIHIEDEDENMNLPFVLGHSIAIINCLLVDGAFDYDKGGGQPHEHAHCLAGQTTSPVPSSSSIEDLSSKADALISPSVVWLATECLKSVEKCIEPDAEYSYLLNHSAGSSSKKKFLGFKETLSMFRKGKYIFGGSVNQNVTTQTIAPLKNEKSCYTESENRTDMIAVDSLRGKENPNELNCFILLKLCDWPPICYDVSAQDISIHIPLHRLLALILLKALSRCLGDSDNLSMSGIDTSTILDDVFGYILKGTHRCGFSGYIMEHPLRNRVFFAQVHAGMWRKNGDAPIMSCEWYRSVRWAEQGLELDLFLLQCCASLAPANDFIKRIAERFGLSDYFNLNSECSDEYEIVLVQEMLVLMIQVLQERRYSGLSAAENLRKELIHKLAVGDATRSQIVKSLPRDLSKIDQLQEILDSVATYSNPSGLNQGMYSLRGTCWKELDLYYPRWNSRDLQTAEERMIRYSTNLSITTQLPRWKYIYAPLQGLARIATCKMSIQAVRAVIFYAVYSENKLHSPDALLLSALHFLSLSLSIYSQQRESTKITTCTTTPNMDDTLFFEFTIEEVLESRYRFKGEDCLISLLVSLMKMQKKDSIELGSRDICGLIETLLKKMAELDPRYASLLQRIAPELVVHLSQPIDNSSDALNDAVSDSEKRKAKARERQAAIMARMKAEQSKFMSSMSTMDEPKQDIEESDADTEGPSSGTIDNICSLCHDRNSKSPISFLILLQKSRLLSLSERVPPSWNQQPLFEKDQYSLTKINSNRFGFGHSLSSTELSSSNHATFFNQNAFDFSSPIDESAGHINLESLEKDIYFSILNELNEKPSGFCNQGQMGKIPDRSDRKPYECFLLHKYVAAIEGEVSDIPSASETFVSGDTQKNSCFQSRTSRNAFILPNCDGVYLSSCGHAVHRQCLDRYLSSLKERYLRRISFEGGHIVNPDQGEFLCPVCRCLANSILPGCSIKGWKQPIMSQREKCAFEVSKKPDSKHTSLFVNGLSLLQSVSDVIRKEDFVNKIQLQPNKRLCPDIDYICRTLLEIYFPGSNVKFFQNSRFNPPMIMWDVLTYSLASTEIAARCGKTHLSTVISNEALHHELKSVTGFALSLLLSIVQSLRSENSVHVLQRFKGILHFANSICSGASTCKDWDSSFNNLDNGLAYSDTQLWDRAANPILSHDSFSSLMLILFCLPHPFLSCETSFLSLVHVLYAVTVVQAIIVSFNMFFNKDVDLENGLVTDIFVVLRESSWLCKYFVSEFVVQSSTVLETINRLTSPFLRRCSLLWKVISSSNFQPFGDRNYMLSSVENVDELHEIEEVKASFKIPQLNVFLNNTNLKWLAMQWVQHFQSVSAVEVPHIIRLTPSVPLKLMRLPHLYQDLLQRYIKQRCGDCKNVIDEPALCLFCGKLCSPNWKSCCRENRCQAHAVTCGAGIGVYLMLRRTTVLLQRSARQSPWPSLYLDSYGEEDIEMHRGKPLYLNEERYAALTYMVASHGIDRSSKVLGQTSFGLFL